MTAMCLCCNVRTSVKIVAVLYGIWAIFSLPSIIFAALYGCIAVLAYQAASKDELSSARSAAMIVYVTTGIELCLAVIVFVLGIIVLSGTAAYTRTYDYYNGGYYESSLTANAIILIVCMVILAIRVVLAIYSAIALHRYTNYLQRRRSTQTSPPMQYQVATNYAQSTTGYVHQQPTGYVQQPPAGYVQQPPTGYVQPATTGYVQPNTVYAPPTASPYPQPGAQAAVYPPQNEVQKPPMDA